MATDIERLVVSLEARINQFDKAMAKANGIANSQAKKIESRFDKLSNNLNAKLAGIGSNAFGGFVAGLAGPIAGLLSMQAAINGTKAALDEFGKIADDSLAAGLDAEFFQAIAYQASLGGVAIDQVSAALATFNKNAGLAAEGKGRMVAALQALDPELLKNIQRSTDQETRIKLVADALAQQTDASTRAAIATAAFGDAGLKLAGVFAGGAAEIDAMASKAKDMGLIVDRDLIARADELGDQFDTTSKILDLQLKQALVSLGPILVNLTSLAVDFAAAIGAALDKFNSIDAQQMSTLENTMRELGLERVRIENSLISNPRMGRGDTRQQRLRQLLEEEKALLAEFERRRPKPADTTTSAVDPLAGMRGRGGPGRITPPEPFYDPNERKGGRGGGGRNADADAAVRQAEAVRNLITDLQFEQSLIGKSALEQEVLTTLRRADVDATSEQGLAIRALIEDIDAQSKAQAQLEEALATMKETAQQFASSFVNDMLEGATAAEALQNALAGVAKRLLDMALDAAIGGLFDNLAGIGGGGGGTGNAFGDLLAGLFGGKRAAGGPVTPGKAYLVGEKRPELFVPSSAGTIIPRVPSLGGGGMAPAQQVGVAISVSVDDDGKLAVIAGRAGAAAASTVVSSRVPRMINDQAPAAVAAANMRKRS